MYSKIINPITNKKININSKIGKKILKNYIKLYIGGAEANVSKKERTFIIFAHARFPKKSEVNDRNNSFFNIPSNVNLLYSSKGVGECNLIGKHEKALLYYLKNNGVNFVYNDSRHHQGGIKIMLNNMGLFNTTFPNFRISFDINTNLFNIWELIDLKNKRQLIPFKLDDDSDVDWERGKDAEEYPLKDIIELIELQEEDINYNIIIQVCNTSPVEGWLDWESISLTNQLDKIINDAKVNIQSKKITYSNQRPKTRLQYNKQNAKPSIPNEDKLYKHDKLSDIYAIDGIGRLKLGVNNVIIKKKIIKNFSK